MIKRSLSFGVLLGCAFGAHAFSYADAGVLVDATGAASRTEKAGETVQASGSVEQTYTTRDGSTRTAARASASVQASASIGLNRLGSGGGYAVGEFPEDAVSGTGPAVISAQSYSRWYDTLRVTHSDSNVHAPVRITFHGTTLFGLQESSPYFIGPSSDGFEGRPLSARQSLFIGGADMVTWTMKDFVEHKDTGRISWSFTWDHYTNLDLIVGVTFSAGAAAGAALQLDPRCGISCQGSAVFASYNTTMLDRIVVDGGNGLTSSSGELVAKDGYYAFQAVLDHTSPVPEPSTLSLLAIGIALVLGQSRRPDVAHAGRAVIRR